MLLTEMVEFNHYVISEYFSQFCAGLVQFSLNKSITNVTERQLVKHSTETRLNSISCG